MILFCDSIFPHLYIESEGFLFMKASKNTFKADTTITSNQEIIDKLVTSGWEYKVQPISKPKSDRKVKNVGIFSRTLKENDLVKLEQRHDTVSSFTDIESIKRMRCDGDSLVLGFDTEFYYLDDASRLILTYQIAFKNPLTSDFEELLFCSFDGKRISLSFIISYIISTYNISFCSLAPDGFGAFDYSTTRRWVYHTINANTGNLVVHYAKSVAEAVAKSTAVGEVDVLLGKGCRRRAKPNAVSERGFEFVDTSKYVCGYINDFGDYNKYKLGVTLLCHAGKADISALINDSFEDALVHLSDVQGGYVTLSDFTIHPPCIDEFYKFYPVSVCVRDTMCFAPAGAKALKDLGKVVGIPKLDVSDDDKNNMLCYLLREPVNFAEYSINDSLITLVYACELWGYNSRMPVTVSGASVKCAVPTICDYFGIPRDKSSNNLSTQVLDDYNRIFRGLHKVKKGLVSNNKFGFIENSSLEPVSDNARIIQNYSKNAYKGGYNGCNTVGYFCGAITHDYDLENAYPSCMALVPDVDWSAPIKSEIVNRFLTLDDVPYPLALVFGYVTFRFPDNVKFPCIPVSVNGSMIFPRSSDGLDGVYVSAPEIYLALKLGASVYAKHVYSANPLLNADGSVSLSLRSAVKQLVNDRNLAKKVFGKKSLAELLLKIAVNSLYGKTAQDLIDKESWNAYSDKMVNIGGSLMTSPTHATLTTAGVRCVLLASLNQLSDLGFTVYSVTTDGFISDAPFEVLDSLDLYGFNDIFRSARVSLVGSNEMWSEKHHQTDLLNFTTRGNTSLEDCGVNAHNSFVTGFDKDTYLDRLALMTAVLGRDGKVSCHNKSWAKHRQLASRFDRQDFFVKDQTRDLSMDFDLKRKPVESSFKTVFPVVDNITYEIANFTTEPYSSVSEYELYKKNGLSSKVLRTFDDWSLFFAKVKSDNTNIQRHIKDLDWSILFTCVMGYRLGNWDIPYLNKGLSVDDRIAWINKFNKSKKVFTYSDWKNCGRHNRQSQMIDSSLLIDTLTEMQKYKENAEKITE